jgi:transposase
MTKAHGSCGIMTMPSVSPAYSSLSFCALYADMFCMKAYPIELRKRVLHAIDSGMGTRNQIAAMFSVSTFWIYKLLRQMRDFGDISPQPQNQGRKAVFAGSNLQKLDAFVAAHPDATLEEIREQFSGRVDCSIVAIHNTLKRLGWNYKKKRYMRLSKTGRM